MSKPKEIWKKRKIKSVSYGFSSAPYMDIELEPLKANRIKSPLQKKKIILDLCGGTGSWSKPYKDAGYDVRIITLPEYDLTRWTEYPDLVNLVFSGKVLGILAAPPCTHFTNSGAQYWKAKDQDGRTLQDTKVLTACLMIIALAKPEWWVLENPVGRMKKWLGNYQMTFNPCHFGDPYTKKTCLWGRFTEPFRSPVIPEFVIAKNGDKYSKVSWYTGGKSDKTKTTRSVTPPGFAKAFMEANP